MNPGPADSLTITDADFASFLDEVAREVAAHVEPWRLRVGEAVARWSAEGFSVTVLERALRLTVAPDIDALLATYESAVTRLQQLRAQIADGDAKLAAHPALRDPARLAEAETLLTKLRNVPSTPPSLDPETWVLDWPDVRDLLVEVWP